jgi:hypothetical protein
LEGAVGKAAAADALQVDFLLTITTPLPLFYVSVASKGLKHSVSALESTLTGLLQVLILKGVTGET